MSENFCSKFYIESSKNLTKYMLLNHMLRQNNTLNVLADMLFVFIH